MENTSRKPWVEKYRPTSIEDVVSHAKIKKYLKAFAERGYNPNMIFYGMSGTGKTSTVISYVREVTPKYLELNGSDERGMDVVRDTITNFCKTVTNHVKAVILDEVDAMPYEAQVALKTVIESYSRNTFFVLICNYVNKIIYPLQSQCAVWFRFAPIDEEMHMKRLQHIEECEGMKVSQEANKLLVHMSGGDMRKSINVLHGLSAKSGNVIEEETVRSAIGLMKTDDESHVLSVLMDSKMPVSDKIHALEHIDPTDLSKLIVARKDFYEPRLLIGLAKIELALDSNCNRRIQCAAIIALVHNIMGDI